MAGRNLIICCDGTNNQFGSENTNVVRLIQVLNRDDTLLELAPAKLVKLRTEQTTTESREDGDESAVVLAATQKAAAVTTAPRTAYQQLPYYDPGVGTLPEPGLWSSVGKKASQIVGLAFGTGLKRNVEEAYTFLMQQWEPDDRVFIFGFSRGAYTARVLAGLLHALGLLPRGSHNLVTYAMRLYESIRDRSGSDEKSEFWRLCHQFRSTFARPVPGSEDKRHFRVHFLGVWDTVSSVGWAWDPLTFPYTSKNPSISVIRHAIAIDERRWFYRQNQMTQADDGQDFLELWFPGVHSDIGGGYPEQDGNYGLWRIPFEWMLGEATRAGLSIDTERKNKVLSRTKASAQPWNDDAHRSLTGKWWPCEFFPKFQTRTSGFRSKIPSFGLGRYRYIPDGSFLHQSTLLRIRESGYAPANLTRPFLKKVCNLSAVPDYLPYNRSASEEV